MRLSSSLILLVALLLGVAGVWLVAYSRRLTNEATNRRIGLVRAGAAPRTRTVNLQETLVRAEPTSAETIQASEIERIFRRFRAATGRALTILIVARACVAVVLALAGLIAAVYLLARVHNRALPLLVATALGIVGWFIPGMVVAKLVKRRLKAIEAGLPDALELLVICVEAGLSFEDGIDRISRILAQAQPALAEELAATAADLKILPSREAALANLATRVAAPSVRSVVTTLSQTLRYGTPLAQALRMVARELRNESLMRLEERANQLPTLMTIPMMLFIMPTIFMVVAGPAALKVIDTFKH